MTSKSQSKNCPDCQYEPEQGHSLGCKRIKSQSKCCDKCICKCKGAVTAHYGCDNYLCSCHTKSEEPHKTVDNYCCACPYDIAGFEERIKDARTETIEEVINELGSNPNEDGSQSPNIQHWIERKQIQLRKLFLKNKEPKSPIGRVFEHLSTAELEIELLEARLDTLNDIEEWIKKRQEPFKKGCARFNAFAGVLSFLSSLKNKNKSQ